MVLAAAWLKGDLRNGKAEGAGDCRSCSARPQAHGEGRVWGWGEWLQNEALIFIDTLAREVVKSGGKWIEMDQSSIYPWSLFLKLNSSTPANFVTSSTIKIASPFLHAGVATKAESSSFCRKRLINFFSSCRRRSLLE